MAADKGKAGVPPRGAASEGGYLNAFELVRQLFQLQLPTICPLQAMKLTLTDSVLGLESISHIVPEADSLPQVDHWKAPALVFVASDKTSTATALMPGNDDHPSSTLKNTDRTQS